MGRNRAEAVVLLVLSLGAWTWGASALAQSSGPTPASTASPASEASDVIEFPEVFFSSQTFAPLLGPGGCVIRPSESRPAELKALACEPDPKLDMCRSIDSRTKEKAREIQAQLNAFSADLMQQRTQAVLAVSRKLGAAPPVARKAEHEDFSRKFWKLVEVDLDGRRVAADARMVRKLEPSRPQVEARIQQVRNTLIEAILRAKGLGADGALLASFLDCKLNIGIEVKRAGVTENAFMWSDRDADAGRDDYDSHLRDGHDVTLSHTRPTNLDHGDSVRINPLSSAVKSCNLSLSPRVWLACAQSESMCAQFMMHEFGHVLDSCHIHQLGKDAEAMAREASSETDRVRLNFLGAQARKVARTVFERTACLAGLVAPGGLNAGLPNQCAVRPLPKPGTIEERCQEDSVPGYPGQWGEAEADFWGASGMARYLEKNHPTLPERARAVYETWALSCQNEVEMAEGLRRVPAGTPAEVTEASQFVKTILSSSVAAELEKKKDGCESKPAGRLPSVKPWLDSHQDWDLRVNRNFLRNADMRRALGCNQSHQFVPLTCGL